MANTDDANLKLIFIGMGLDDALDAFTQRFNIHYGYITPNNEIHYGALALKQ